MSKDEELKRLSEIIACSHAEISRLRKLVSDCRKTIRDCIGDRVALREIAKPIWFSMTVKTDADRLKLAQGIARARIDASPDPEVPNGP